MNLILKHKTIIKNNVNYILRYFDIKPFLVLFELPCLKPTFVKIYFCCHMVCWDISLAAALRKAQRAGI